MKNRLLPILVLICLATISCNNNANSRKKIAQPIDSFNNVQVFYNGGFSKIHGRNVTPDGYNLGLKYQCVEFVKRYYFEHLNHKMPNSYGHAKDFFNGGVKDGGINKQRNLIQYRNPSRSKPKVNDLLIFSGSKSNKYGHVAIVSKVTGNRIEIIQQNVGTTTRASLKLNNKNSKWNIVNSQVLGWLRKE
ncbi:MAG: CHAP domain-containing protein [Lutibacter sp.]|nr:CHAP domain-containing protein [Lutibacter sp.]